MEYTEEEKKAIENVKIILNSNIRNPFLDDEADSIDILLNLIEKQNKEIARLDGQNVVINYMRSGKNLLSRIATDYAESTLRVFELQSVSGYTIDFIIDLFKRGFVLVNEEDYISKEAIREKIKELEQVKYDEGKYDEKNSIYGYIYEFSKSYEYEVAQIIIKILKELLGE